MMSMGLHLGVVYLLRQDVETGLERLARPCCKLL